MVCLIIGRAVSTGRTLNGIGEDFQTFPRNDGVTGFTPSRL